MIGCHLKPSIYCPVFKSHTPSDDCCFTRLAAMVKRKLYDPKDLEDAIKKYLQGMKLKQVLMLYPHIPRRTITYTANRTKSNKMPQTPGPKPLLTDDIEKDLESWIVAMQSQGLPVTRQMVLNKANEIYKELCGRTRASGWLKRGWLERFMQRHPTLCLRTFQVIKRVRVEASEDPLRMLMWELVHHAIEQKLTSDRVFNMDETGFAQKSKSKIVVAVKGSRNVWTKSADVSFHLTLVVTCAANGFVVPPLFIIPGQRPRRNVMDACDIPGGVVTTSSKGFMNSSIFLKWLQHFESNIPVTVKRPVLLVYDGYGSHYNEEIIQKAVELKIILVLLPANATHLVQPLDIAVFRPFKTVLKRHVETFMIENAVTSLSKQDGIKLSSSAWKEGISEKSANIISGFKSSGIWPISFPAMQHRW